MTYLPSDHTFVICAFQESPYLEACICSLLRQHIPSQILITTSTPNDYIFTLADTYSIPVFINQEETGIAADWNFALSSAHTPLITLAHQDDIYEPEYVDTMLHCINRAESPLLFFSGYYEIKNNTRCNNAFLPKLKKVLCFPIWLFPHSIFARRCSLSFGNCICCPSVTYVGDVIKSDLFQPGLKSNLDWLKWEELSRHKGSFVYFPMPLMGHRIHEGSETSHLLQGNLRTEEDYQVFLKFWPKPVAELLTKVYSNSEKSNRL